MVCARQIVVAMSVFVYVVLGKSRGNASKREKHGFSEDSSFFRMLKRIADRDMYHRGALLAMGDKKYGYVMIKSGKLKTSTKPEDALLFDLDVADSENSFSTSKIRLFAYINGVRNYLTYNLLGDDVNMDTISVEDNLGTLGSFFLRQLSNVSGKHKKYQIIPYAKPNSCLTRDAESHSFFIRKCRLQENSMQTFRFVDYQKAKDEESKLQKKPRTSLSKLLKYISRAGARAQSQFSGGFTSIINGSGMLVYFSGS